MPISVSNMQTGESKISLLAVSTDTAENCLTSNTESILNTYYSAQNSPAFEMLNKKIFTNLLDDWTAEISGIENPVWNYDSFTQYEILDHDMLSVSRYEELYYCTFSADNDKFGYVVVSYGGSSLQKISAVETPYLYDLKAIADKISDGVSETEIDLSSSVASRVRLVDTDKNRTGDVILFTDNNGNNYICYLSDSSFKLTKLPSENIPFDGIKVDIPSVGGRIFD